MPRKFIDKKTAAHFTLVHRPQNDPRIHDNEAPAMVLNPTQLGNAAARGRSVYGSSVASRSEYGGNQTRELSELAEQLGDDAKRVRANEGEAASHGVFYDDTEYDYMQHLRDLGTGDGGAVYVEANTAKAKPMTNLSDALAAMDLQHRSEDLIDEEFLPSKNLRRVTYQNQQDVPDAIAGFQPDMDPRLREVLEALDDDAYVDNENEGDDDMFAMLAQDGEELEDYEFEETYDDGSYDDDGWESDATEKPTTPAHASVARTVGADAEDVENAETETAETETDAAPQLVDASDDWMEDFKKFKKDQATGGRKKIVPAMSDIQSSIWTTDTAGGRKKKRKGALTQQSGFSMSSSSLVRTDQLSLLDARFEKIDELYNVEDDEDMASMSQFSSVSSVTGPLRNDFDGIMDEFLGGYSMRGKRNIKKGREQSGLEQLDEIRRGLGAARFNKKK